MQARTVELNSVEREQLQAMVRRTTSPSRDVFRARIVLDAADGLSNEAIAAARKTRPATVSKWRGRFLAARLEGLGDAPRSGKPVRYNQKTERRILQQLDRPAPSGYARWNGTLLPPRCQTFPPIRSGEYCASTASACNGGAAGVSVPI